MSVPAAYFAVVLVWSTTPLGIVWSSESVSPTMAVLLRMVIAVLLGGGIIYLRNIELPKHREALKVYGFSSLGIFGGMMFSYMAAAYIPSGMMSLIFGLSPILSALLAQKLLNEPKFSMIRKISMLVSFVGLAIVCSDSISFNAGSELGLLYILTAVFFFSLSGVLVKSIDIVIHPMATTVGALAVSIPLFLLAWVIMDGTLPIEHWQSRSIWAIVYLGVFGSFIGFVAYFYVLQKLSASTVALITMMTPVFALTLGAVLNDESISARLVFGAVFVISGLSFYHWGEKVLRKKALLVK
ncbi:DMT family transporter [Colwelliaceae bacterium 6471]